MPHNMTQPLLARPVELCSSITASRKSSLSSGEGGGVAFTTASP